MTKFLYFGNTSSYKNILFLIVLFSFCNCERIKRQGFLDLTQISRCRSPLGEVGVCLAIKQCSSLMDLLLKERHRPEVVNYLRSSVCGYENLEPKVCCTEIRDPSSLVQTTSTPSRPTTPPFRPTTAPFRPTNTPSRPQTTPTNSERYETINSILPKPGECGVSPQFNVRVVGGSNASLGAWPWVVALGYKSTQKPGVTLYLCGGSLITNRHVLTAAHCVYNRKNLFMARLGDLNLFDDNDGASPEDIPIAERFIHRGYNPTTYVNDIAVLRLQRPVQFTRLIKPICIPIEPELRTKNLVNRKPFIAGWGTISFNGPSSAVLQQLQVPVVSDNECRRAFFTFKNAVIDERVLCAGYLRGGKDACRGDSGGPLMDFEFRNKLGVFYQIGVVSYGYKCAEPGFPGVYTRVASFTDWILEAVSQ